MHKYLQSTEFIDSGHRSVLQKAVELAAACDGEEEIARRCFEFVRDQIKHSWDFCLNPVTCRASDVLKFGTGYCYAKSHLLAALLRANGIPAGLCYQRLSLDEDESVYCLHGLTAAYLPKFGWYRMDPRGNKDALVADFCPPVEGLPFPADGAGEGTFPQVRAEPLPVVTAVLLQSSTYRDVAENLPDIPLSAFDDTAVVEGSVYPE